MVAFLVLGLMLSGCVEEPEAAIEPYVVDRPHAFSAVVSSVHTGNTGYMNLSGPIRIADRTGSLMDVYVYEQAIPFEGEYQRLYHYLDGDLRDIVVVLGCGYVLFGCDRYKDWNWEHGGRPGPDGIGYPNLISKEGALLSKDAGHEERIPWEAEVDAQGRLVLKLQPPWARGETLAYRYTEGRALPDGPRFTVERYEDLGPLAPIAPHPLPVPTLAPRAWQGLMFPGENEDPFAVGATHAEIVTHAFPDLATDPNACVQYYELKPNRESIGGESPMPIAIPSPGNEVTATSIVAAVQGNNVTEVGVVVTRDSLNESIKITSSGGQTSPALLSCAQMNRSPWPQTDFDTALTTAADLLDAEDLFLFTYEVGFMARYRAQDPEHGLHTYRFDFLPPGTSGQTGMFDPYRVHFESSGPLATLTALAHPDVTFER